MNDTPIFRDTLALSRELLAEAESGEGYALLRERLARGALRLLDHVVLAVGGFDRYERLLDADAELRTLRAHLLLAFESGVLEEEVFLGFSEQADRIGRQIGGWLRKLDQVS